MIAFSLNGEDRRLPAGTTLVDLLDTLGCSARGIAIVVNAEVVPRSAWGATSVATGDRVEVLRAVQGGC